ncbi:MAG: helix-turn-helix domain-containing protein [Bacteroidota bacterium]
MSVIKKIRAQQSYTQNSLAQRTGLSLRTIQRLEASNNQPKGHTLKMLAEAFDMPPSVLLEQFQKIDENQIAEKRSIQFINLSILSFIGIPFGNIILPLILWSIKRKSKLVDESGRRILNFQIIWWVITAVLLSISPFLSRKLFSGIPVILYVLLLAYAFNLVVVFVTAMKLKKEDYDFLDLPLRLV